MVRELKRTPAIGEFPPDAPTANPVFYRTYSRRTDGSRETWRQVCDRTIAGLTKLGNLSSEEVELLDRMQHAIKALPSGRWLWVGGTKWLEDPNNYSGAYNCTSTNVVDWQAFGLMMSLAMMGSGTGAVLEPKYIDRLPQIRNRLNVEVRGELGRTPASDRREATEIHIDRQDVQIHVGDSRGGWVNSYQALLELSGDPQFGGEVNVTVNVSDVRPSGEALKGFGGVANPVKLPDLYPRVAKILNRAIGRQLNSEECCLLIDEAAVVVVAGNVRRSAGIRQFSSDSSLLKENLWQQGEDGNWRIDPERDALRMANHTRVFHRKPSQAECIDSVRSQFYSGEGAIQWAGEAVARSNADLLSTPELKAEFVQAYQQGDARSWMQENYPSIQLSEIDHRMGRYGLNPCVTADTWIHTEKGAQRVKDLIGVQQGVYVNGELFSTTKDGFFYTGTKPIVSLTTKEGFKLRLTPEHKVLKVTAQTQHHQYTEWVSTENLNPGDRIKIHNHRGIRAWDGVGTYGQGWLLGNLIGDGSLAKTAWNDTGVLRYWGDHQDEMSAYASELLQDEVGYVAVKPEACYYERLKHRVINSPKLAALATNFGVNQGDKHITDKVEQGSYDFYRGFIMGFFDADGSVQGSQTKGISVRLAQSNLKDLQAVQRMLLRLGIASTIYKNRRQTGKRLLPDSDRKPKLYNCHAQHELVIARDNLQVFQKIIGFRDPDKSERLSTALSSYKRSQNQERFVTTVVSIEDDGVEAVYDCTVPGVHQFDANGLVAHNCGEIIGDSFHCNLSEIHLNRIDPNNDKEQEDAFKAGAISVATLLNHKFVEPRYQYSRELDPIVGVSFTGLFDFFVKAFGVDWLHWWEAGRPDTPQGLEFKRREREYLTRWSAIAHATVWDYCDRHGLKRPNRCTTIQPSGTKSLLTSASPGWHPPKAARYIRRITFGKNDPVALACIDCGYRVVPSQSDRDENGALLDDPFDPRCSEWLVEIPVAVTWADLPGADKIDISKFSALAQFDFYIQVQKYYTTHNTSATIEFRENEIEALGNRIAEAIRDDEGYISAALLARFDAYQAFPRLPFEPIDKDTYDRLMQEMKSRRSSDDFHTALDRYDSGLQFEAGPVGCDSDKCLFPEQTPNS